MSLAFSTHVRTFVDCHPHIEWRKIAIEVASWSASATIAVFSFAGALVASDSSSTSLAMMVRLSAG